jgi:hypothetical protein
MSLIETLQTFNDEVPFYDHVVVHLAGGPTGGFDLVDRVTAALERAGDPMMAEAFVEASQFCDTEDELLDLVRRTVTLL